MGGAAVAQYGGGANGANDVFSYDQGLGAAAMNQAAPTIANTQTNSDRGLGTTGLAQQQQGMDALAQTANGQGPAIQAARQQLATNTQQGQNSTTAIANSAQGGGRGLAAAGGNASMQNAQSQGGLGQQQAQLQAQMQTQAAQQYQSAAQGYASSALGMQNSDAQGAQQQAMMAQQQQQLGQQGMLGFLGYGNQAETNQAGMQASQYATYLQNQQQAKAADQAAGQADTGAIIGLGMGALAAL